MYRQNSRHVDPLRTCAGSVPPKPKAEIYPVTRLHLAGVSTACLFDTDDRIPSTRSSACTDHPKQRYSTHCFIERFHTTSPPTGMAQALLVIRHSPVSNERVMKLQFGAAQTGKRGAECLHPAQRPHQAQVRSAPRRPMRSRDSASSPNVSFASLFRPSDKMVTARHKEGAPFYLMCVDF